MCMRFNATIIPTASVGVEDALEIVLDSEELTRVPYVREWLLSQFKDRIVEARRWRNNVNDDKTKLELIMPLVRVAGISRQYFGFGRPIETSEYSDREGSSDERDIADQIYQRVKRELESLIDTMRVERDKDPYKEASERIKFELLNRAVPPSAWEWETKEGHCFEDYSS